MCWASVDQKGSLLKIFQMFKIQQLLRFFCFRWVMSLHRINVQFTNIRIWIWISWTDSDWINHMSHLCESVISLSNHLWWLTESHIVYYTYPQNHLVIKLFTFLILFECLESKPLFGGDWFPPSSEGTLWMWRSTFTSVLFYQSVNLSEVWACFNSSLCSAIISPVSVLNTVIQHSI